MASLEDRAYEVSAISIGAAMANLASASVTGGISSSASLMKMNEAAQMQTIVVTNTNETRLLLVDVFLPLLCVCAVRGVDLAI